MVPIYSRTRTEGPLHLPQVFLSNPPFFLPNLPCFQNFPKNKYYTIENISPKIFSQKIYFPQKNNSRTNIRSPKNKMYKITCKSVDLSKLLFHHNHLSHYDNWKRKRKIRIDYRTFLVLGTSYKRKKYQFLVKNVPN